jgi:hypothetical protein
MTKGEAYKAYYQRNRERILANNKERNRLYRETKKEMETEEDIETRRQKEREYYTKMKTKHHKTLFLQRAETETGDRKIFYTILANTNDINSISKKTLDWLLHCVPATENKTPATVDGRNTSEDTE